MTPARWPRGASRGAGTRALLIAAAVWSTMRPAMSTSAPPAEVISIHYTREVGWSGSVAVEIARDGDSTAVVTFNYDGRPEIGTYQRPLDRRQFDELLASLTASGYSKLAGQAALMPGAKTTSLGVRRTGDAVPLLSTFEGVPPPLADVVRMLDRTTAELRQTPVRVLRAEARWAAPRARRGGEARLAITLSNPGRAPVTWHNPAAPLDEWNGVRLVFITTDSQRQTQVDLTGADMAASPTTTPLLLAPGQTITLEARPKLDVHSGDYATRVELHQLDSGGAADPRRVDGTLSVDAGRVTVARDGWWKLWR